jgi:uncharacterized protein
VERHCGVAVDVCENGCRGIWFDAEELSLVSQADESASRELVELQSAPPTRFPQRGALVCPRCGMPMRIRLHDQGCSRVYVDECTACGGIFVDAGELAQMLPAGRAVRPLTLADRQRVAEEMVRESGRLRREEEAQRKRDSTIVDAVWIAIEVFTDVASDN